MIVIGIDPGIAITGYGVVREESNGELIPIEYGVITTLSSSNEVSRLLDLYDRLSNLLELHQPDSGAVEKLFFQKNAKSAMSVGQARGVVLLSLARRKIPVYEYAPVEVKQAVSGYGGADKKQMQLMVKMRLNLDSIPKPDDAADALAIAICHLQQAHFVKFDDRNGF
jgi:crossover junction endodeoxyribonuclease RuvC